MFRTILAAGLLAASPLPADDTPAFSVENRVFTVVDRTAFVVVNRTEPPAGESACVCGTECKCKQENRTCPGQCPVWHTDYDAAVTKSRETGRPLLTVVGTENCLYCRKMESGPFRDPAFVAVSRHFVLLKLDADKRPDLAKALAVQVYPTTFVAGPDRTILARFDGYVAAENLVGGMKKAAKRD